MDVTWLGDLCAIGSGDLLFPMMGDSELARGEEGAPPVGGVEGELWDWFRLQGASAEGSRKAIA